MKYNVSSTHPPLFPKHFKQQSHTAHIVFLFVAYSNRVQYILYNIKCPTFSGVPHSTLTLYVDQKTLLVENVLYNCDNISKTDFLMIVISQA